MKKKIVLIFVLSVLFPSVAKAVDLSGPIWGLIQGMEAGQRARQAEQEEKYMELLMEKQKIENDNLRKDLELKAEALRKRLEKEKERQKALEHFITYTKPKIVAVHPDFDLIMKQESYWEWTKKQTPALRYAATDSPDPDDIIWALSEYKKWVSKITGIPGPITFRPQLRESLEQVQPPPRKNIFDRLAAEKPIPDLRQNTHEPIEDGREVENVGNVNEPAPSGRYVFEEGDTFDKIKEAP